MFENVYEEWKTEKLISVGYIEKICPYWLDELMF